MVPGAFDKDRFPRWAKDVANRTSRSFGLATSSWRPPPDFLIIGAKRGGTTSLFNYLLMHPGVLGLFPQVRTKKSTDFFFTSGATSDRWYRSHFHTTAYRSFLRRRLGYTPLGGEASPHYVWDPRIAERARRHAPSARAILLLRDPVQRAWSHYQERRANGVETLSFEQALDVEEERTAGELERMLSDPGYYSPAYDWYSYHQRGIYLPQLRNWLASFPAEQLLVLRSEDMYEDVQGVYDQVCAYLQLPGFDLPTTVTFNASGAGAEMSSAARRRLCASLAPHVAELETFLGRDLRWSTSTPR